MQIKMRPKITAHKNWFLIHSERMLKRIWLQFMVVILGLSGGPLELLLVGVPACRISRPSPTLEQAGLSLFRA